MQQNNSPPTEDKTLLNGDFKSNGKSSDTCKLWNPSDPNWWIQIVLFAVACLFVALFAWAFHEWKQVDSLTVEERLDKQTEELYRHLRYFPNTTSAQLRLGVEFMRELCEGDPAQIDKHPVIWQQASSSRMTTLCNTFGFTYHGQGRQLDDAMGDGMEKTAAATSRRRLCWKYNTFTGPFCMGNDCCTDCDGWPLWGVCQ